MTPPREWLKPPRSLLLVLFIVTLVAVSALAWLGWRLLDQERLVEAQRSQERLEQAADRMSAVAREGLAETGERLGAWALSPPSDLPSDKGLLLILSADGVVSSPGNRLVYVPSAVTGQEAPAETFQDGEALEFQQPDAGRAVDWYRRMAESKKPEVRAGALLRLARVLRREGLNDQARAVYSQLASIREARVAGLPAELVGRAALCELSCGRIEQDALKSDLLHGRFAMARGQFEFYWSQFSQAPAPVEALAASELAAEVWQQLSGDRSTRGQSTVWVNGRAFFLMWRGVAGRRAVLAVRPELLLSKLGSVDGTTWAAVDGDGRLVAGRRAEKARATARTPGDTQLPWTLYVSATPGASTAGMIARQRFLLLVTAVTVVFLIGGAYFIGRAVRRDLEVSRMQSDFVSAVSHEFRSPLTSMRQLSEILALGRVPNDARRQLYYETLVSETTRLQRLVEGLLNFGRMEAGVRQYRFEEVDAAALVTRVTEDFRRQMAASGRSIELTGVAQGCVVEADPEALSVALRNLVDNAIKYSPDTPTVWVDWGTEHEQVTIRVRDRGLGIPAAERRAIFRKFVRGSAAAAANVRGSGVGLAMVRHIVAAHGGAVTLASAPGLGTTFTVMLPAGVRRT